MLQEASETRFHVRMWCACVNTGRLLLEKQAKRAAFAPKGTDKVGNYWHRN